MWVWIASTVFRGVRSQDGDTAQGRGVLPAVPDRSVEEFPGAYISLERMMGTQLYVKIELGAGDVDTGDENTHHAMIGTGRVESNASVCTH